MADNKPVTKQAFSADWFLRGALTRIGDTFDRFTGRKWTPSSSLATSELVERMKKLLDAESREIEGKGILVPHNIKLKVQWDKFASDSDVALATLENELLVAAADHINDKLYYTKAPLTVEVKPDYFTEGVKLFVSFERFADEESDAHLDLTLPGIGNRDTPIPMPAETAEKHVFIARFAANGSRRDRRLEIPGGSRLSVGRTSANDLVIEDPSISKTHASIVVDASANISVADTGSTNGTFINGERIAYGKAVPVKRNDWVKFGMVDVLFEFVPPAEPVDPAATSPSRGETIRISDFEFTSKTSSTSAPTDSDDKTIEIDQPVEASTTEGEEDQ